LENKKNSLKDEKIVEKVLPLTVYVPKERKTSDEKSEEDLDDSTKSNNSKKEDIRGSYN